MKISGNKIIIEFDNPGKGLISKDGKDIRHFAIAGSDKKYFPAHTVIKGNTVEVWSDAVANPVSVYYAWADNPENVNLFNSEGIPASPFKSEQFETHRNILHGSHRHSKI